MHPSTGGQIGNVGARVEVRLRLKIEQPVVSTWPPCAICLLPHVEGRRPIAAGSPDDALLLQLGKLLLGNNNYYELLQMFKNTQVFLKVQAFIKSICIL